MGRPDDIVLDDLVEPRISETGRALIDGVGPLAEGITFDPAELVARARATTGLDDLGPDHWREPFEVLTASLRDEAGFGAMGRVSLDAQLHTLLCQRLLLFDLVARHPEISAVELEPPIVVVGLPRSGTTHLHQVLAADPRLRSLGWVEATEPFPAPGEAHLRGAPDDPRVARVRAGLDVQADVLPHFRAMHEMDLDHVAEEIHLLALDFATMYFDTLAVLPTWRDWYRQHDHTPHYRTLRLALQALTWLDGPGASRRWVLKSPQHLEQFVPLVEVFPDATFVVTHRDPVEVTRSLAGMLAYVARLHFEPPVPVEAIASNWARIVPEMLAAATRDRDVLGERSMDVTFDEFMADDEAVVDRIHDLAGFERTPASRAAQAAYARAHPRNRWGRVRYDLCVDVLGLDEPAVARATFPYRHRFGV